MPLATCREPLNALAQVTPRTMDRAEELFAALGARVSDPWRDYKYDTARVKIANAALLPSRVWGDTAVWTGGTSSRRTLLIAGRFADGRYRLEAARNVPYPTLPAESRHLITLTRLSDDEYAWDTEVPYAIGSITARELGAFVAAMLASAEGRDEKQVRADYRTALPRASAILGQLFTVDSIRTVQHADSSTSATFAISLHPARVERRYPNFAEYLRRYIETGRMNWSLADRGGLVYLTTSASHGRIRLQVRTRHGEVVPIEGTGGPIPDTLRLHGGFTAKVRRLTVGLQDYRADLTLIRNEHERAMSIVSREEPKWTLPLVTETLLKTPLRRPFQGRGFQFRLGVRDSAGAQTILMRRMHLEVQESAILRFIGKLGATAVGDYQGKAEREQLAWLREVFDALVEDVARVP